MLRGVMPAITAILLLATLSFADSNEPLLADISGPVGVPDGVVNNIDFAAMASEWADSNAPDSNTPQLLADIAGPAGVGQPDGVVDFFDLAVLCNEWLMMVPPSPNPMTWAIEPHSTGSTSISMTATTATCPSCVEYYFTCIAGGGHDSGSQAEPNYIDTGLLPGTTYTYTVKARNMSTNHTETTDSEPVSATTEADTASPSPNPMTWATAPHPIDGNSISMTATTATDVSGVEYYFKCVSGGGHDSGWQAGSTYTDTTLGPGTYSYQVSACDTSPAHNQTGWSAEVFATISSTIPLYEFNADSPELVVKRNSIGYVKNDSNFLSVEPDTVRPVPVCISSKTTLLKAVASGKRCLAVDSNKVFFRDAATTQLWYLIEDANADDFGDGTNPNYRLMLDIVVNQPFAEYCIPGDRVISMKVMPDGSWILCAGNEYNRSVGAYLFRSTDKGTTWNVCCYANGGTPFQFLKGFAPGWGWGDAVGSEIVVGEYGDRTDYTNNPRRVYYSDDYGATWTMIFDPGVDSSGAGTHCHIALFAPGDSSIVYASYGDASQVTEPIYSRRTAKIVHTGGNKKDPNNWSFVKNILLTQPVGVCSDGRYLYWGKDGSDLNPTIIRHDPCDDDFIKTVLNLPARNESSEYINDAPYDLGGTTSSIFSIFRYDGVIYVCTLGLTVDSGYEQLSGGFYVSNDGLNWVRPYRITHTGYSFMGYGLYNIAGYANGYLWGTFITNQYADSYPFKMKPVKVRSANAISAEVGITNLLTEDQSDEFSKLGGFSWSVSSGYNNVTLSRSTDYALHESHSLKITGRNTGNIASILFPSVSLTAGDYFCVSFWVRHEPFWPRTYSMFTWFDQTNVVAAASNIRGYGDWQKVIMWGRCINTSPHEYARIVIVAPPGQVITDDAVCYIDAAQIVKFPASGGRHYSGLWQIGGTPRANEHAVLPLSGTQDSFTTTFEWQPMAGEAEFRADLPIACWTGANGSYINLTWEQSTNSFKLTDNESNTLSSATTHPFMLCDFMRFAMTSNGTRSTLFIQDSLNNTEVVDVNNVVHLSGSPYQLKLGTTFAEDAFGCGAYANIRVWDSILTSDEVEKVFDTVDPMR